MKTVFHSAESRGGGEHGWLSTRHSFSFANWYDPERMGFGALRVLNDDLIAPHQGFGAHPHQNFEIITIVEKGVVTHEDSMGNVGKVGAEEVQVMSAGTGVVHGERNDEDEPLELFQLWIAPNQQNITPRYEQKTFAHPEVGKRQLLISGAGEAGSLTINQDARIYRLHLAAGGTDVYKLGNSKGVYVFVVAGSIRIENSALGRRDALGIRDTSSFSLTATNDSDLLLIEVPLV